MKSSIKSEKKNSELLQSLAKKANLQKQKSYYFNFSVVSLIAIIVFAWLKIDWKWISGSIAIFVFAVMNYYQISSPPAVQVSSTSQSSNVRTEHLNTSSTSNTSIYAQRGNETSGDSSRILKPSTSTRSIPSLPRDSHLHGGPGKALSPLLANKRLPSLTQPAATSPLLRSPELSHRDGYDLSFAKKIASEAVGSHSKPHAAPSLPQQSLFSPNSPYGPGNMSHISSSYRSPLLSTPIGASSNSLYPPREYQISPLNTKPVQSNAVQQKDALQALGLTQIPDEWIDELRLILGKHLHLIMEIYHQSREDIIQVLKRAMMVPVYQGGISEKDFQQALVLLDYADQERSEKLENGHSVNLKNLLEYIRTTNLIPNLDDFINQFEFSLSFFRLCQFIIKQKQQNIQKIQEIERMKNDIIEEQQRQQSFLSNLTSSTTSSSLKDRKKGFIIEKLQQLVNNSYEKRLIIQWRHPQSSGLSGIKLDSFFSSGSDTASSSFSSKDSFITDQEIVLALFLHRCNHLSQTMFNGAANLRLKSLNLASSTSGSGSAPGGDGNNAFSEEHLIFNYTIDLYRTIKLLQERNREDDNQRLALSTTIQQNNANNTNNNKNNDNDGMGEDDQFDYDINENSIISFIYHTPNTIQSSENLSPNPLLLGKMGHDDMNSGNGRFGGFTSSTTSGIMSSSTMGGSLSNNNTVASSIQDYISSIKSPHFDIIKMSYNGKKREIFKIDYTRNDCYESILIFILIIYLTTLFQSQRLSNLISSDVGGSLNYDDLLMNDSLFDDDITTTSDGRRGGVDGMISLNDAFSQRDFKIMKTFVDKMIPKADLRHMLVRFHQQSLVGSAGMSGGIAAPAHRGMFYDGY